MIANFPRFSKATSEAITARFRDVHKHHLGVFGEAQRTIHHEGVRGRFVRSASGKTDIVVEPVLHSVSSSVSFDEIIDGTLPELLAKFDAAAEEMAGSSAKLFYQRIDEAVAETGNSLDMNGKPLTGDAILKVLEMMDIAFDRHGNALMPTLVVHPSMAPKLRELEAALVGDTDLARRREDLVARKREEWRAREANRRLAG